MNEQEIKSAVLTAEEILRTAPEAKLPEDGVIIGVTCRLAKALLSLNSQLEKAEEVLNLGLTLSYLNECHCHETYSGRGMHEPNATCGEMDDFLEKARDYFSSKGQDDKKV